MAPTVCWTTDKDILDTCPIVNFVVLYRKFIWLRNILVIISAKWTEWNWRIYCFHFCLSVCLCVCVCAHSVQSSTVCVLGISGWSLGYEERRCWAIVRAISFQDFQPTWSWSTNVTDIRTDRQTDDMRSQDHALHYSASRSKYYVNDTANLCKFLQHFILFNACGRLNTRVV